LAFTVLTKIAHAPFVHVLALSSHTWDLTESCLLSRQLCFIVARGLNCSLSQLWKLHGRMGLSEHVLLAHSELLIFLDRSSQIQLKNTAKTRMFG
jgi:hypothetical protein